VEIRIGFWFFFRLKQISGPRTCENSDMVDLHCHILPGVDDGARSIAESLNMLRNAVAEGVETVVATPHLRRGFHDTTLSQRQEMTADLQKAADENGINIQIKPGVEYYVTPQVLEDLDRLEELSINNNGKYLLLDLPMRFVPPSMDDILFSLKTKGITAVLAHPERNTKICRNPNILFDLVEKGCLIQINSGSILGYFGRESQKAARSILTHKLAHVIASDMHSAHSSTLGAVVSEVEGLLGEEQAARLFVETPQQILDGEDIYHEEIPLQFGSRRKGLWGLFSRSRA